MKLTVVLYRWPSTLRCLLGLVFICFTGFLIGQVPADSDFRKQLKERLADEPNKIEFLLKEIDASDDGLTRAVLYNQLGVQYQKSGNLDSARYCHTKALDISRNTLAQNEEVGVSYNKIGIIHFYEGNYDSASFYMQQAVGYIQDLPLKANVLNNIALASKYAGYPEKAVAHYLRAIDIFAQLQDTAKHIVLLNNIGALYFQIQAFDKASEYHTQALDLSRQAEDQDGEITSTANLANVYKDAGDPEKAIPLYLLCIAHYKAINDHNNLIANTSNLASVYEETGRLQKASDQYQSAIQLMHATGYTAHKAAILINAGGLFQKIKAYEKALSAYREAYQFAYTQGQLSHLEVLYGNLSALFKETNQLDSSLHYRELQVSMIDSLEQIERQKQMLALESKHQNKQLSKDLALADHKLKEQQSLFSQKSWIFLVVVCVTLVLAATFMIKNVKKKKESAALKSKIKELDDRTKTSKVPYPDHLQPLTKREIEVLRPLAEGLQDDEIAERLFISVSTVRTHLRSAFFKIKVRNRAEAIPFLIRHHLNQKTPTTSHLDTM